MKTTKTVRRISNTLYAVGVFFFAALSTLVVFGAQLIPNPEAMIPWTMREIALIGLAGGAIPMLLVCAAVYRTNDVKQSVHKRRNLFLIFLPGLICGICLLTVIGIIVIMMVQAVLHICNA